MSIARACDSVSNTTFKTVFSIKPLRVVRPRRAKPAQEPLEKANRNAESTRVRLPNKTQWALRDILGNAAGGRGELGEILAWIKRERLDAKGHFDSARLARLGELSDAVAQLALHIGEMERLAADARAGIYEQPIAEGKTNDGRSGR